MKKPLIIILLSLAVGISIYYGVNEATVDSINSSNEDADKVKEEDNISVTKKIVDTSPGNVEQTPTKNDDEILGVIEEAKKMADFSCKLNNLVAAETNPAKLEELRIKANKKVIEMKYKYPTAEKFDEFSKAVSKFIARDCVVVSQKKNKVVIIPVKQKKSIAPTPKKIVSKKVPLTRAQLIKKEETMKLVRKRKREQIMRERSR